MFRFIKVYLIVLVILLVRKCNSEEFLYAEKLFKGGFITSGESILIDGKNVKTYSMIGGATAKIHDFNINDKQLSDIEKNLDKLLKLPNNFGMANGRTQQITIRYKDKKIVAILQRGIKLKDGGDRFKLLGDVLDNVESILRNE